MDQETSSTIEGVRVPGFSVVRRIGIGGFATVYEAVQEDVDAPVALKVLALDHAEERVRARFERECRTMGSLRGQRGIVPVYQAAYTADGRPVIVMALMSGGTLLQRLERDGPLPMDEVVDIGITIAGALQTAHDRGVHHRDVKPENILLDDEGRPGLSDFGIATIGDLTNSTRTVASLSPPHASPERFRGTNDADPTSGDVYSLASTLYHLLSGHPPFGTTDDGGLVALLDRVLNTDVPPIDRDDVPEGLVAVLATAMSKDPVERQPSAREFSRQLEPFRATGGGSAPPSPHGPARDAAATKTIRAGTHTTPIDPPMPEDDASGTAKEPQSSSNPTTIITNPNATRIIAADAPVEPDPSDADADADADTEEATGDPPASSPRSHARRYIVSTLATATVLVVVFAAVVVTRSGGNGASADYSALSATATTAAGGVQLTWTSSDRTVKAGETAVAYCTSPSVGSEDPCPTSIERLTGQDPAGWTAGEQPGTRTSPVLTSSNTGPWTAGSSYCFAIIDNTDTSSRNDRLSDWSCTGTN